ncbi:hypothetical protein ACG0Z6_11690 [Roseateles sp. BYS180W]|uniref:Uncharacterized protein n=1 Tax=Roseateles rivi TaxID=3299028 RepID=A0ABW7FX62_9BURK
MNRWPPALQRAAQALGWPGAVGGLALLVTAALALGLWPRWAAQQAQQEAQLQALEAAARSAQSAASAAPPLLSTQAWQANLPEAATQAQRLAELLELGLRHGVNAPHTEHRLQREAQSGLQRLQVRMPVQAGYAELRQFIEAALLHDPALSLDGLKLQRKEPQDPLLEAELLWSLHARSTEGTP